MITCSIGKEFLTHDKFNVERSIFVERINYVISKFVDLMTLKQRIYSQFIQPSIFPSGTSKIDFHLHFIIVYGRSEELSSANLHFSQDIVPPETTHVVLVDVFGRIMRILPKEKHKDKYLLKELYGNTLIKHTGDLDPDKFKVINITPLGWVNIQSNLFHTDKLGFRFQLEDHQLPNKKEKDTINVAIVGNSFSYSMYSLPGESFAEKLNKKLQAKNPTKRIKIWNLSQGSATQAISLSILLNLGIIRAIDYVIWIDGLNDLWSTVPASAIGLPNANTSFSIKTYLSGLSFDKSQLNSIKDSNKIETFLSYRRLAIDILEGLGIKTFNFMQPVCDLDSHAHSLKTKELIPFFDKNDISVCTRYPKLITYVREIGKSKYGIDFKFYDTNQSPLEFLDSAHLSPEGEIQYADYLFESISDLLNINP